MRADLLQKAADLARRGEPFVLAVVVRRLPASSSREGDMALVTADGAFHGWLGGSCTQPRVVEEARRALAERRPRLLALAPDPETERRPGVVVAPMTCHSGGSVEIYIEPILPAPRLAIFGGSPVAQALAALGEAMGWSIVPGEMRAALAAPAAGDGRPAHVYAVVATAGENDEDAVLEALAAKPDYLGVVASRRRFAEMRKTLAARGVEAAALDAIRSPAGLDLGGRSPAEIALSIVAEIVARRHEGEIAAATGTADATAAPAEPATAIDPICGMTVEIATAKHTAEHAGRTFYFCCGGCRSRFLAAPERWLESSPTA